MAARTDDLSREWELENQTNPSTELVVTAPQVLSPAVSTAIAAGGDVEALDLLPDERWADVPYLPADVQPMMVEQQTPFRVIGVSRRTSEYGAVWKLIMDFEGRVFSFVLGGTEEWRNQKMERIGAVLEAGARSVGPFILTEVDTGKGNPFRDIRAVSTNRQALPVKGNGKGK